MSLPEARQAALCQQMANARTSAPALPNRAVGIPSWGWDLRSDTAGTKIHHQMLKCSTAAYVWWIIRQSPNLRLWSGGVCSYHLFAGNCLTPRWEPAHTSSSDTSLSPLLVSRTHFHTNWQEQSLFLHCYPLFIKMALKIRLVKQTIPNLTGRLYLHH